MKKYSFLFNKIKDILNDKLYIENNDCFYQIEGNNNHIFINKGGKEFELTSLIPGLDIRIKGNNNTIRIEYPFNSLNSRISIENDNVQIDIGSTNWFHSVGIDCFLGNGQKFRMGGELVL